MTRHNPDSPLSESAMGGTSDSGAHGTHPASAAKLDARSARPEDAPGDAAVERRKPGDRSYNGPERRLGRAGGSRANG
jgi:hypothetical protein